jgi:flagellar biosynthesis/type III secretory pathway protein FliH
VPQVLTIQVAGPISGVRVLDSDGGLPPGTTVPAGRDNASTARQLEAAIEAERARLARESEQKNAQFDRLCRTAGSIAGNLDKLYQETLAGNRSEIARLAVEIARKILVCKIAQGDYDIQAIVEEALKRAPTRQQIVIRLNPQDLPRCQQYQQENPEDPFAGLELAADPGIGPGECLVETPKGIVKSFIEEHLERIGEALKGID